MIAEIFAVALTMTEEEAAIKELFDACVLVSKDRQDVEMCVKRGAEERGIRWSCTIGPDGNSKACTPAVWTFEHLWSDLLFNAAQELIKKDHKL